jgi:hypothetical protein
MEKGVGGLLESSREHFTVVLLANPHPNAYVSCSHILKLPPLCHNLLDRMSAVANQKFNQLYLQRHQPLQNHLEDCCEGPHQDATGA